MFDENIYRQYMASGDFDGVVTECESEKIAKEEYEKLKTRIDKFKNLRTITEARSLAKDLFNIKDEINYIKAGDGCCTIINRADTFRIILNSDKEMICYNFLNKKEI